ncbi:MAG: SDR family oxidoreductase [Polyangiaceae bacterium]
MKKDRETGAVKTLTREQWDAVIAVNLTGATFVVRDAVAKMVETGSKPGVIVNMSSIARHGNRGQSNYSAAKAALAANTKTWSLEFAQYGIRVGCVAPGMVETPMTQGMNQKARDALVAAIPVGRVGVPEDLWLAVKSVRVLLQRSHHRRRRRFVVLMSSSTWRPAASDELRDVAPGGDLQALAAQLEQPLSWLAALRRPLVLLVVIGGFVSITAAGRFTLPDVLATMLMWAFAPFIQLVALTLSLACTKAIPSRETWPRVIDLYFAGQGPWLLFLCVFAMGAIVLPDPGPTFSKLLRVGVVPGYLLLTIVWGIVTTHAFFRHALSLARGRAAGATAIFYVIFVGWVLGYYLSVHELQPLVAPP